MIETKNILDLMKEKHAEMTKKQQLLADYLVKNYSTAAFMNTKEIAKEAKASESTLLRLVALLNFNRFADFQDALQALVRDKMSSLEMYKDSYETKKRVLDHIVDLEVSVLKDMVNNIDEASFSLTTELLDTSKYVYIVGLGADEVFSRYLFRFLSILRHNVIMVAHSTDPSIYNLLEERQFSSSVVIAFHFPRYYKSTYDICRYFVDHKTRLIAVTDNILAPMASIADILLQVPTRYVTAVDPAGAGLVLIHALITGVIMRNPEAYKDRLQKFYSLSEGLNNVIRNNVALPFNIENIK